MAVCPLCRGSGFYGARSGAINCPLCRGKRRVDQRSADVFARRPIRLRRIIRRGIAEETARAGMTVEHAPVAGDRPSRTLLGIVVLAWAAYEAWTAIRFVTRPASGRPQDFVGTWILVSGGFACLTAIALKTPGDVLNRVFRRGR
jgi:hypothetical protein